MPRRTVAIAGIVGVMVIWGTTYIVTKYAVDEVPPGTMAVLRFAFAFVVLLPVAIARGGLARLPRPLPIGTLLFMGITGFALYYAAFNYALLYGSASQGALIQALLPVGIAGAAVLVLKERLSGRRMLGVVLSIVGVALVIVNGRAESVDAPNPLLGAVLMLASVVAWAAYTVAAKRISGVDPIVTITCTSIIGTVFLIPMVVVELAGKPLPAPSLEAWLSVAYLGIAATGLALIIYSWGLRELDATVVGVYVNLVPIIGVLSAVLFLGESLAPLQIVGGTLALVGMWLAS